MNNQYVKIALTVLAALAIGLQTAYPQTAWIVPVTNAILATLGALHLVPAADGTPPAGQQSD